MRQVTTRLALVLVAVMALAACSEATTSQTTFDDRIAALETELDRFSAHVSDLSRLNSELTEEIRHRDDEIDVLTVTVEALEAELQRAEAELERYRRAATSTTSETSP